jgi:CTP:molybdopterin cytidylyltransferase MocA
VYQGHGGHPFIFSLRLLPELLAIEEVTQGIRAVMERHKAEVHQVPFDTPLVRLDINAPQDYQEALRLFSLAT